MITNKPNSAGATPNSGEGAESKTDVTAGNLSPFASDTENKAGEAPKADKLELPGSEGTGKSEASPETASKQTATSEEAPMQRFFAKIVKAGHEHAGVPVKKDATIEVDLAEYRWLLDTGIGTPGKEEDAGLDVTKKGEVIRPESDAEAVRRMEAEFNAK